MPYNGFNDGPEQERESEWQDPEDADESWRGEEHQGDGEDWRLGPIGPEEQMFRKMIEDDEGEDGS